MVTGESALAKGFSPRITSKTAPAITTAPPAKPKTLDSFIHPPRARI
jgi:hypothetical protein